MLFETSLGFIVRLSVHTCTHVHMQTDRQTDRHSLHTHTAHTQTHITHCTHVLHTHTHCIDALHTHIHTHTHTTHTLETLETLSLR